jgi:prepilin-type N-terminal cleavage/methylation domain-containing protein
MNGMTDMSQDSPRRKEITEAGFSLLELMIVTAIIAVMSAVAVPNFLTWNARYQLRQAGVEIQNQLTLAKMVAMNRNVVVNASLSVTGGRVQLDTVEATSGTVVFPSVQMMSHVTGLAPAPTTVAFSPLGIRAGGGAGNQQIVLTNSNGVSYSLRVTPRGKVDLCLAASCP